VTISEQSFDTVSDQVVGSLTLQLAGNPYHQPEGAMGGKGGQFAPKYGRLPPGLSREDLLKARRDARAKYPAGHPDRVAAERAVRQFRKNEKARQSVVSEGVGPGDQPTGWIPEPKWKEGQQLWEERGKEALAKRDAAEAAAHAAEKAAPEAPGPSKFKVDYGSLSQADRKRLDDAIKRQQAALPDMAGVEQIKITKGLADSNRGENGRYTFATHTMELDPRIFSPEAESWHRKAEADGYHPKTGASAVDYEVAHETGHALEDKARNNGSSAYYAVGEHYPGVRAFGQTAPDGHAISGYAGANNTEVVPEVWAENSLSANPRPETVAAAHKILQGAGYKEAKVKPIKEIETPKPETVTEQAKPPTVTKQTEPKTIAEQAPKASRPSAGKPREPTIPIDFSGDDTYHDEIRNALARIPPELQQRLTSYGVQIHVSDNLGPALRKAGNTRWKASEVVGFHDPDTGQIYIKGNEEDAQHTALHEVMHAVDNLYGRHSNPEFSYLVNKSRRYLGWNVYPHYLPSGFPGDPNARSTADGEAFATLAADYLLGWPYELGDGKNSEVPSDVGQRLDKLFAQWHLTPEGARTPFTGAPETIEAQVKKPLQDKELEATDFGTLKPDKDDIETAFRWRVDGDTFDSENDDLRDGEEPSEDAEEFIDLIGRAKPFKQDARVYRGVEYPDEIFGPEGSMVGKSFVDNGFVATTADRSQALLHGYDQKGETASVDIYLPRGIRALGTKGLWPAPDDKRWSAYYGEGRHTGWSEYTLRPGHSFLVLSDKRGKDGIRRILIQASRDPVPFGSAESAAASEKYAAGPVRVTDLEGILREEAYPLYQKGGTGWAVSDADYAGAPGALQVDHIGEPRPSSGAFDMLADELRARGYTAEKHEFGAGYGYYLLVRPSAPIEAQVREPSDIEYKGTGMQPNGTIRLMNGGRSYRAVDSSGASAPLFSVKTPANPKTNSAAFGTYDTLEQAKQAATKFARRTPPGSVVVKPAFTPHEGPGVPRENVLEGTKLWNSQAGEAGALTPSEVESLDLWYGDGAPTTNDYLRGVTPEDFEAEDRAYLDKSTAPFTGLINRSTPFARPAKLWRRTGDATELFGPVGSHVGEVFTDKGFVSLSPTKRIEAEFGETLLSVFVPAGTHALKSDEDYYTPGGPEFMKEYTLPPNTQFRIARDEMVGGKRQIELEVVPSGEQLTATELEKQSAKSSQQFAEKEAKLGRKRK
jgi:hypothetical protein